MDARLAPVLAAALVLCIPAIAFARPADVRVINTRSDPVFVQLTDTATVQIAGTPTVEVASNAAQPVVVQPAREPFQQFVSASTTGSEVCETIVVPEGKRLTIESFAADATSTNEPNVLLRVAARIGFSTFFRRPLRLALTNLGGTGWAGDATTLLHTGTANDDSGAEYSYAACVQGKAASASFSGLVSGWLE